MKQPRYKVIEGSETGHCCFEYTVIDTTKERGVLDDEDDDLVCECFEKEHADKICNALNELESK